MSCPYCNASIYLKQQKILKDLVAPLTSAAAARQALEDMTGEMFVRVTNPQYCFACGAKLNKED